MLEMLKERKAALEAQGKKGFTLMEMLIVIAIIAILIAIAIPIFTEQMERAQEATDAANLRSAYATASAALLTQEASVTEVTAGPVTLKQTGAFDKLGTDEKIGNFQLYNQSLTGDVYVHVTRDGNTTINTTATGGTVVDPISGAPTSTTP